MAILTKCSHILIADDEADILFYFEHVLKKHHIGFRGAANGQEVLSQLDLMIPSLLLSDIKMPIMDGFDLIRTIRHSPNARIRNLPAIALTAYATEEVFAQALAYGYNDCLFKPFTIESVFAAIERLTSANPGDSEGIPFSQGA